MGDAKWVKYLCRLGFSVDFVHRLGAGIDSMGKLLFHVLIGLGYFPNAKERITDCISICSKQEIFSNWLPRFSTHLNDKSRNEAWEGHSLWQSRAILPAAGSMHRQSKANFTCTAPGAYSILHTHWDQSEVWPKHFSMAIVMWKAAAHKAV